MSCSCQSDARAAGGEGSRIVVDLDRLKEAGWKVEKTGKRYTLESPSPKKKRFRSTKEAEDFLKAENIYYDFVRCICGGNARSATEESSESDDNYLPGSEEEAGMSSAYDDTPVKVDYSSQLQPNIGHVAKRINLKSQDGIELPINYFVGMTNQLGSLLDQVNTARHCATPGCDGFLVPVTLDDKGLGGAIKLNIVCNGCGARIHYASSMVSLSERRRNCVSLALGLCFLIWGHGYASYHKILKLGLGIHTLTYNNFYKIVKLAHPCVKAVLDEICEMGKSEMKVKTPPELGSWRNAVTTSDGCWLIRGHHSQCCTFVIINFLTGCTLYYGHACMRGSNNICDSDLWEGTAKAAEGHLAEVCFTKAKEEGMVIAVNWQDADSSSAKSFRYVFPDSSLSRVMLCGGHVGRSHANNLKEYKGKKSVDLSFVATHKKNYPELETTKCECAGKRAHSKTCGCMSDEFLGRAKSNHFSALKQSGNDPEEYASRMRILGKYHSRDIHEWTGDDGETYRCPWHPIHVCSCGNCDGKERQIDSVDSEDSEAGSRVSGRQVVQDKTMEDSDDSDSGDSEGSEDSEDSDGDYNTNFTCEGRPYKVRGRALTCDLHSLLYEIECNRIAEKANEVIDPVMGKGHSNLPESKFSVLTKFRPKDTNLHQMHYEVSTNMGLCQSNMTYLIKRKGSTYHWVLELFGRMGLPQIDGIEEIISKENSERMKRLNYHKTDPAKRKRVAFKQRRQQEQKKRRQFTKRQRIIHTYGIDDEEVDLDEDTALAAVRQRSSATRQESATREASRQSTQTKTCVCGGKDHMRRSSSLCPLNKRNV